MPTMPHPRRKTFTSLPLEVNDRICSLLPKSTLCHLRRVNRLLGSIATPRLFRSLHLQAFGDSPHKFIHIALSDELRCYVKEITCDTWIGPGHRDRILRRKYQIPRDFVGALPFLRCFYNLGALHLRFSQYCGRGGLVAQVEIEESIDFRYQVLDTVFQCLAGTWSSQRQQQIDRSLHFTGRCDIDISSAAAPISLSSLTITNLGDYHDPRLTNSDAFKAVLASGLVDLRLYITTQLRRYSRWRTVCYYDKHGMFESLPTTWLSLPLATNLKVLSLYCYEYWGWNPKMDFRAVGGGGGLPNLKVLALGKYVFSHQWQADWFISPGLEELYLDDCRIIYQSRTSWTPDDRTVVVGQDVKGHDKAVSNKGYLRHDDVWNQHSDSSSDSNSDMDSWSDSETDESKPGDKVVKKMLLFTLRWHTLLSQWRDSMPDLKVFRMGSGAWDEELHIHPTEPAKLPSRLPESVADRASAIRDQRLKYNAFRNFKCPSPSEQDAGGDAEDQDATGLRQDTEKQLLYVYDDMYQWCEWKDWTDAVWGGIDKSEWVLEDGLRAKDEAALELLSATVAARRSESCGKRVVNTST